MAYTCPSELADVLPSLPIDSMVSVERHVAYDVLSDMSSVCELIQRPIRWKADWYTADGKAQQVHRGNGQLHDVCTWAESVFGIDRDGNKITPTFSLV